MMLACLLGDCRIKPSWPGHICLSWSGLTGLSWSELTCLSWLGIIGLITSGLMGLSKLEHRSLNRLGLRGHSKLGLKRLSRLRLKGLIFFYHKEPNSTINKAKAVHQSKVLPGKLSSLFAIESFFPNASHSRDMGFHFLVHPKAYICCFNYLSNDEWSSPIWRQLVLV